MVIAEVIGFAVHRSPLLVHWSSWYHWARKTGWDALVIRVWSAILIVIGVLLLALELKPRRATRLPLRSADDATDAAVTRRSLAGMLRAAATGVDGISSATVKVRRRRARITAASAARGRPAASALTDPVTQALRDRLDCLDLRHPPRLKVHVVPRSADARRPHQPRHAGPARPARPGRRRGGHGRLDRRVRRSLFPTDPFENPASRYIGHHGSWLWPAVAGACLLIALACLR